MGRTAGFPGRTGGPQGSLSTPRRRGRRVIAVGAVTAIVTGLLTTAPVVTAAAAPAAPAPAAAPVAGSTAKASPGKKTVRPLCDTVVARDEARCFGMVVEPDGVQAASPTPTGLSPADIRDAYKLPEGGGAGRTVGIVVAYDAPTAEADLVHYRETFGLPALAPGQFRKVDQRGGTDYPAPDEGWAGEAALDVDAVTAVAPQADIVLVVADSPSFADLGEAVNQAVAQGAEVVNNSYGTSYSTAPGSGEDSSLLPVDAQYYDHPGVAVVASTGDDDYGVSFPASSNHVTAVGGTSLVRDTSSARGWTESVWHNSYGGPGSGCSIVFDAVPGQQVTGCSKRAVSDVSAVADPETGLSVYYTYGGDQWSQYGGTSLSSPLVSGMYALAGKPAAGSYPNAYPYAKQSAFFDVTTGNNGSCTPSVLCTAGAGWDGPTGIGTPNGVSAFSAGPQGTVTGVVTAKADGSPLAGATVSVGDQATVTTGADGSWTATVPPGSYTVTFAAYGYKTVTRTGVVVTDGGSVTASAALVAVPSRTVAGTVKDGSGHGYPLYSVITVGGAPGGPVYTDPFDGSYALQLPQGGTFTLTFTPIVPGYLPVTKTVKIGSTDRSLSVAAKVDPGADDAPGYTTRVTGTVQGFDGTTAPAGWTVQDLADPGWGFTDPGNRGNLTGGTGGFAMVDSDKAGSGKTQDSYLVSPVFDLSKATGPVVEFDSYFKDYATSNGTVELSSDGGTTWKVVYDIGSVNQAGHVRIPVAAADRTATVQVRFHYTGSFAYYWEIDNVLVGDRKAVPVSGGLLAGVVKDGNTGAFVGGAVVSSTDEPTITATTGATGDPAVGVGYYWLFSKLTGARQFTVSKTGYDKATVTPTVRANLLTRQDATLAAGRVEVSAADIAATVKMGTSVTKQLTLRNTGTVPAAVTVSESDGGFVIASAGGAQRHRVAADVVAGSAKAAAAKARAAGAKPPAPAAVTPSADAWTPVTDLPTILQDSSAVLHDGTLYSVGGYDGSDDISSLFAYDPQAATWTEKAPATDPREAGQIASIGGKLVWTGGWGPGGSADGKTEIYDPSSDSWSTGAANPKPQAAAGKAVIGSKLYLVGGCDADCGSRTVQVYDTAANSWASAADYPQSTSWIGCGGLGGKVYCAGGYDGTSSSTKAYAYDPASDAWSPVADLPADLWGSFSAAANGQLLIAGGVVNASSEITNEGYAYDPAADAWSPLPNLNTALYRGSGAAGFYAVGGNSGGSTTPPSKTVQLLPGYDQGGSADVPWLSEDPQQFAVDPGSSVTVQVTLDASDPSVAQPGTYTGQLVIATDTPYQVAPVGVTMTATPPKTWGKVAGTVTAAGAPVAGATVELDGYGGSHTLTTDAQGKYALWLDRRSNPVTAIVAKDGYRPQTATIKVVAGQTVTKNWVLVKK